LSRDEKKTESEASNVPKTSKLEPAKHTRPAGSIGKLPKKGAPVQSDGKEGRDYAVEQSSSVHPPSSSVQSATSHKKPTEEIPGTAEVKIASSPKKRRTQSTPPRHVQIEDLSVKAPQASLPKPERSVRKASSKSVKALRSQPVIKANLLLGTKSDPSSQSKSSQPTSFTEEASLLSITKRALPAPVESSEALGSGKAAKPDAVQSPPTKRLPFEIPPILLEGDEPTQAYAPIPALGAKFPFLAKGESRAPAKPARDQLTNQLPDAYGTGKLLLLARDPHTVYTSWDFTDQQQREFNAKARDHHLIIRLYRERIDDKPVSEVHVHPESRHWFVHVDEAATQYVAQLGFFEENGTWIPVTSSTPVMTPAEKISEQKALRFATVHQTFVRPPKPSEYFSAYDKPSLEGQQTEEAATRTPFTHGVARENLEHNRKMVVHGPIGYEAQPMGEYPKHETAVGPALFRNQSWTSAKEQELWEEISFASKQRNPASSIDVDEHAGRKIVKGIDIKIPDALETRALSSEAILVPPTAESEMPFESISSAFGGQGLQRVSTSFWFNVNAELIIYGATEPDASVSIGGRRIRLRPDGSFSYRFSLPDGQYPLPVIATSKDDDVRSAELTFSRNTVYSGEVGTHRQDPALNPPKPENLL